MDLIRAVVKEPHEDMRVQYIDRELETLQSIVNGYIEVTPFTQSITMIMDEEGKIKDKPHNFDIHNGYVVGTAIFVSEEEEDLGSLTNEQIREIMNAFN